jgi:DNA-directed RNA polymerase specialized sigma24 family protein
VDPVAVFSPAPLLTITVEAGAAEDEIHVHAGGQGVWVAQMVSVLGVPVSLCSAFAGETGTVVEQLLEQRGMAVRGVSSDVRGSAYVHDRRDGERRVVAEMAPDSLSRHDADELYGTMLAEGMNAAVSVLTGSTREVVPVDTFRRLAADLRHNGRIVVADLSGEQLTAVLEGGVTVLKVAHGELVEAGLARDDDEDADFDVASGTPTPAEMLLAGADALAVRDCVDRLDAGPKQAIALAFFHGLSHAELALHLREPIGTVKSWIRRALETLRRCLDAAGHA